MLAYKFILLASWFPVCTIPKTPQSFLWFTCVHNIPLMLFHVSVLVKSCWSQAAFEQPLWECCFSSYSAPKAAKSPNCQTLLDSSPFLIAHWSLAGLFAETMQWLFPVSVLSPILWNFLAKKPLQAFSVALFPDTSDWVLRSSCRMDWKLSSAFVLLWTHESAYQTVLFRPRFPSGSYKCILKQGRVGVVLPTKHTNVSYVAFILVI